MGNETKQKKATEDLELYRCDGCGMVLSMRESPKHEHPLLSLQSGEFCSHCVAKDFGERITETNQKLQEVRSGLGEFVKELEKSEHALSLRIEAERRAGNASFAERTELQLKQVRLLHQNFVSNTASWLKRL